MPMLQLVVMGNAFGGRVRHLNLALVDEDGGPAARRVHEALVSLQSNGDMVRTVSYDNERSAAEAVRSGRVQGALVLPPHFSRDVYAGVQPHAGLLLDNTDNFTSGTLRGLTAGALQRAQGDRPVPRLSAAISLQPVELYPYVPYMRYMLPGIISLGLFMSVMIGGAILYLDDKQRGVHEGYLVTPITKFELILAQNIAGTIKASVGGVLLTVIGALLAGATGVLEPARFLGVVLIVVFTSFGFMAMTSCLVARMSDPILPRALFGMLNTLLYFPSGAIYPTQSLPSWLRTMTIVDPFSYAVHALRVLLLKGAALPVILPDLAFLGIFAITMFSGAVLLFRRTL
jgi:ABC-2 type transport system permease protein